MGHAPQPYLTAPTENGGPYRVEPGIHPLATWGSRPSGTPALLRELDSSASLAAKFIQASMRGNPRCWEMKI